MVVGFCHGFAVRTGIDNFGFLEKGGNGRHIFWLRTFILLLYAIGIEISNYPN
jgi:hypothetical protein